MEAIQENISLLSFNTFGIDAKARYFTTINTLDEAVSLFETSLFKQKHLFLGGGSNILFTRDFDGLVCKVNLKGIEKVVEHREGLTIKVSAGEQWHQVVRYCVEQDWGGIENLSLIPGTTGASPIQNIGAYGLEIKDVIHSVEALDIETGELKVFDAPSCQFGYRESIFKLDLKNKFLIVSVSLNLTKHHHNLTLGYEALHNELIKKGIVHPSVRDISDTVMDIRQQKLPNPALIGNAGSFFKNPIIDLKSWENLKKNFPSIPGYPEAGNKIKVPAAWLIEQCGWKGKTVGPVGVHKNQALVLVNYGQGCGEDILRLAMDIIASVKEKFDIPLQPEVNII